MKKLLLPAIIYSIWMGLLATDLPVNGNFLPSVGRFLSPFHGIWQSIDANENSYSISGLVDKEVKILFDERDIPHIYAATLPDAIYAEGYLHAAHRLFAMDISTRAAAGRLSELIGQRTVLLDQLAREKGFEYTAIKKAEAWERDSESRLLLKAYIEGINTYIQSLEYKDWPLEYKILSHAPETWTIKNAALAATNLAIALCLREDDLSYTNAHAILSDDDFSFLFPSFNSKESPVIPSEKIWDFSAVNAPSTTEHNAEPLHQNETEDTRKTPLNGSNNWAVSGDKTTNGNPILANDPHLKLTLPSIWYEMEINTPNMSVHGVSNPGLPFILLGFNEDIAWGSTNSGQDVLDWYKITWQDSSRQKYLYDGEYIKATLRPERIVIRGTNPIIDTIRYTHFGPVSHMGDYVDLAMQWIGHELSNKNDALSFLNINLSKNEDEFREAFKTYTYPAQNFVFASKDKNIGIFITGQLPIRPDGQGEEIINGDQSVKNWKGYIPAEHSPFIQNPKRGFVSSANQTPADTTYPYPLLGRRGFEDYRGRIINQVLDTLTSITVEDMMALQQNNFSLMASEILPVLLKVVDSTTCLNDKEKQIAHQLSKWNYQYHRDSLSPVYFELLFEALEKLTWDELTNADIMMPEEWRLIELATNDPNNKYFDILKTTDTHESLQDIVCLAFVDMMESYHNLLGDRNKNWGSYKESTIPHIARFPNFGVDALSTSGGRHIVNTMKQSHGPSWRMIVELSDPPQAWVNYPGGQSGNTASKHFKDMVGDFFEDKYYQVSLRNNSDAWVPTRQINIHPQ